MKYVAVLAIADVPHCWRYLEPYHLFQFFQLALRWYGYSWNDYMALQIPRFKKASQGMRN